MMTSPSLGHGDAVNEAVSQPVPATRASPPESPGEPSRHRRWPWVLVLGAAALSAYLLFHHASQAQSNREATAQSQETAHAVPVVASPARNGDMGVYLNGLGTVTALNTVTVRSRVDGELLAVDFREGQLVHQRDLLAEIDPRPFQIQLTQAEGQMAKDVAALENAKLDLQRYQVLIEQDSVPRQQLDTQAATVRQYEAALKSDQGLIDSARLNLTYCRITAPITGRVGLRQIDPGNMVHASDQSGLVVITQLQPIAVLFTVPADGLPGLMRPVRAGQKLEVDAFDRDLKSKLATGSFLAIDNQIDPGTGTIRVKAQFGNENDSLFPNQFVNARVLVETLRATVIVPTAAIQRGAQSTYVFVVKPDHTVDMRPVSIRLTDGDDTSVSGGVSAGDLIVTGGVDKLKPGTKVAVDSGETKGPRKAGT